MRGTTNRVALDLCARTNPGCGRRRTTADPVVDGSADPVGPVSPESADGWRRFCLSCCMVAATLSPRRPVALGAPAILDIEASGFGRDSYPIEVGYALSDGSTYCSLIRPAPSWTHWDPAAERVHHVSRATLAQHGRDPLIVAEHLNDALHGQTLYCDGWGHDFSWLAALYEVADRVPAFRLDDLRTLLSDREAAHWHVVKQQVATELRLQRHRASADAKLLQMTLLRLRMALPGDA